MNAGADGGRSRWTQGPMDAGVDGGRGEITRLLPNTPSTDTPSTDTPPAGTLPADHASCGHASCGHASPAGPGGSSNRRCFQADAAFRKSAAHRKGPCLNLPGRGPVGKALGLLGGLLESSSFEVVLTASCSAAHISEGTGSESADFPAQKIADASRAGPKLLGSFLRGEPMFFDMIDEAAHEVRPHP